MKRPKCGYALLLLIAASFVYFASLQKKSLTTAEVMPFALGPLSALVLWFWMISNYFANRKKIKHSACWGWSLFLANWVAAIVYFFVMYTPAEKKPRDHYRKFRQWVNAEGKGFHSYYFKIAIVSLIITIFHHLFMDVLYKTINLFNYEMYRNTIGAIYLPLKAFLMFTYGVLNINTAHNTERLVLFARAMRFLYTYLLFCIIALLLFHSDNNRAEKTPVLKH